MKKWIVVVIITSILITSISMLLLFGEDVFSEYEYADLTVEFDRTEIRVNEEFEMSIEGAPERAKIMCNTGDGNVYYGHLITHSYNESDFFTIQVSASWDNGEGKYNTTIGIKNADEEVSLSGGEMQNVRPGISHGTGEVIDINSGISNPIIESEVRINNIIGTFTIYYTVFGMKIGVWIS